jgi:hypothetical protein
MILSSNGGQATFTKSVIFMIFNTYAHHYTVQFIQNFKHLVFVFGTWGADYASPSFDSSWQVDLEPPPRASNGAFNGGQGTTHPLFSFG